MTSLAETRTRASPDAFAPCWGATHGFTLAPTRPARDEASGEVTTYPAVYAWNQNARDVFDIPEVPVPTIIR